MDLVIERGVAFFCYHRLLRFFLWRNGSWCVWIAKSEAAPYKKGRICAQLFGLYTFIT